MEGFNIEPKFNKTDAIRAVRESILSICDEDLEDAFKRHNYTIEPLLMQIIREMRRLNDQFNQRTFSSSVRSVDTVTERSGASNMEVGVDKPRKSGIERAAEET